VAEISKYEILLNELSTMESQVLVLTNKWKDTAMRNQELEEIVIKIKKENAEQLLRISKLENELEKLAKDKENTLDLQGEAGITGLFNSLNPKEREHLKVKLQNLISRIDYHLAADQTRL
jgi:hypothetical protein